jgi:hypothetical protein
MFSIPGSHVFADENGDGENWQGGGGGVSGTSRLLEELVALLIAYRKGTLLGHSAY